MTTAFNCNPAYLSNRLFTPHRPLIGAITHLNVNMLPDLLQYIKSRLTPEQLLSLSQYHLQTYITELSIKEKVTESLDNFVQRIIGEMRKRKEFWMNAKIVRTQENEEKQKEQQKHQHQAIIQFQKDVMYIREKIPQHDQKTFNNAKKRRIQPSFQLNQNTNFIDKQKEILKINLTNYSMMPAYVLRQYLKREKGVDKLVKYENLPQQHKHLLNELQNCVQYFMMQQKPKLNKSQNMRKRQNARQRKLPAYLLENCENGIGYNQHQIEQEIQAQLNSKQSHSLMQNPINPHLTPIVLQANAQKKKKNQSLSQPQQSSQQDSQNQYYQNFHQQVSKRIYYDSKMFNKQNFINQSHNLMELLRCLVYYLNQQDENWFQDRWREQEEQKTIREKRRKQQEDDDGEGDDEGQDEEQYENNQDQGNGQRDKKDQADEKNINKVKEDDIRQKDQREGSKQQLINNEPIVSEHQYQIIKQPINQSKYLIEQQPSSQKSLQQEKLIQQQPIQIGTRKSIFNQPQFKSPTNLSFKQLSRHLSKRFLSLKQIYFLTSQYITRNIHSQYQTHKSHSLKQQNNSLNLAYALIDPQMNLDDIAKDFKQMIEHPEHVKLSAFKTQGVEIPWDDKDYLLFLKGLLEFFFIPTNNRKIAQFMVEKSIGSHKTIQANHVKYVKGIYLKNMGIRIDRGELGGGKKGRMQGKTQFIQKDIEFFSMKYFDKLKKSKKKLRRRRFDDQIDAGEQADSAY